MRIIPALVFVPVLYGVLLTSCSVAPHRAEPQAVPKLVNDASAIFWAVKREHWGEAAQKLQNLQNHQDDINAKLKGNTELKKKLEKSMRGIERAIAEQNRVIGMDGANDAILIAIDIAGEFPQGLPLDLPRLAYHTRRLVVESEAPDPDQMRITRDAVLAIWKKVLPKVRKHNGEAETAKVQQLVDRLQSAGTPADYASVSEELLNQIAAVEQTYDTAQRS